MFIRNKSQRGFTLLEMMVSLALGLLIMLLTIQIFMSTKRNHAQNDTVTDVLENGRFALRLISSDLKAVGFMGGLTDYDNVGQEASLTIANDCGTSGQTDWTYDVTTDGYVQGLYNTSTASATTQHQCIAAGEHLASTDVLAIKRTYGQMDTGSLSDNTVYLRSDYNTACIWYHGSGNSPSGGNCPSSDFEDWRYLVHIYFIRSYAKTPGDGIPTLCRKMLSGNAGAPSMETLCIAQGIEQFHVQYGIDTDTPTDGIANIYLSSPTATQIQEQAVSAKVYILARGTKENSEFTNNKTYTMGDRTVTVNDNYYRRVYSTTVILKNPMNLIVWGN